MPKIVTWDEAAQIYRDNAGGNLNCITISNICNIMNRGEYKADVQWMPNELRIWRADGRYPNKCFSVQAIIGNQLEFKMVDTALSPGERYFFLTSMLTKA